MVARDLLLISSAAIAIVGTLAAHRQQELTPEEEAFARMLRDSYWQGHWYRKTDKGLQYGGEDGYHILRAERVAPGHWSIVAEFKLHGKPVRFAIPARVAFVGGTAVVYLDGLRLPGEPPFNFRVVFHEGMYSGVFTSEPLSGIVLGARVPAPQEAAKGP